jgi:hypothetical protein
MGDRGQSRVGDGRVSVADEATRLSSTHYMPVPLSPGAKSATIMHDTRTRSFVILNSLGFGLFDDGKSALSRGLRSWLRSCSLPSCHTQLASVPLLSQPQGERSGEAPF